MRKQTVPFCGGTTANYILLLSRQQQGERAAVKVLFLIYYRLGFAQTHHLANISDVLQMGTFDVPSTSLELCCIRASAAQSLFPLKMALGTCV